MKVSVVYKKAHQPVSAPLQKDMVDFASLQFKVLVKKNLRLPFRAFQL